MKFNTVREKAMESLPKTKISKKELRKAIKQAEKEMIEEMRGQFIEPQVKPLIINTSVAHTKDGIEVYDMGTYKKCEKKLLETLTTLTHAGIDIKIKDVISVQKGDIHFFKIKGRKLDLGETLTITYWVDNL